MHRGGGGGGFALIMILKIEIPHSTFQNIPYSSFLKRVNPTIPTELPGVKDRSIDFPAQDLYHKPCCSVLGVDEECKKENPPLHCLQKVSHAISTKRFVPPPLKKKCVCHSIRGKITSTRTLKRLLTPFNGYKGNKA